MGLQIAKRIAPVLLVIGGMMSPGVAEASEENANILALTGTATENSLIIRQSPLGEHSAQIMIDHADALRASDLWQRPTPSRLRPGLTLQQGTGHVLDLSVGGRDNQVSVEQTGLGQRLAITSLGSNNIVSVSQVGQGNTSAVTQTGLRNTVAISQRHDINNA